MTRIFILLICSLFYFSEGISQNKEIRKIQLQVFDIDTKQRIYPNKIIFKDKSNNIYSSKFENDNSLDFDNYLVELKKGMYSFKVEHKDYQPSISRIEFEDDINKRKVYLKSLTKKSRLSKQYNESKLKNDKVFIQGYITDEFGTALNQVDIYFKNQHMARSRKNGYYEFYIDAPSKSLEIDFIKKGYKPYKMECETIKNGLFIKSSFHMAEISGRSNGKSKLVTPALSVNETHPLFNREIGDDFFDADITVGFSCENVPGQTKNCDSSMTIPFKDYVTKVISKEWGGQVNGWDNGLQAQIAGAVAIQTYALYFIERNEDAYDICGDTFCQAIGDEIYSGAEDAAEEAGNYYLIDFNTGNTIYAEYARETNLGPAGNGQNCGDGYFASAFFGQCKGCGSGSQDVCYGKASDGGSHNRGMCQLGSMRWATNHTVPNYYTLGNSTNFQKKSWREIINYYYCNSTLIRRSNGVVPSFVCRGACETDVSPVCQLVNISTSPHSITINNMAIEELGTAGASNISLNYFVSPTNSLSDATPLGNQFLSSILGSSTEYLPSISFPIPAVPAKHYNIIVVVEEANDADLTNNKCFGLGPIYLGGVATCMDGIQNQGEFDIDCGGPCPSCSPDINLISSSCASPNVHGDQLDIFYDITNLGSVASGPFNVSYWVYQLGYPNQRHSLNIDMEHQAILGNSSVNLFRSIDLPAAMATANLPEGQYRLSLSIDDTNLVAETNEADNYCESQIYFDYQTLNLSLSSNCLTHSVDGENLNISYDIINEGIANSGPLEVQFFVWDEITFQNYIIGPLFSVNNISGNSTITLSSTINLDAVMSAHGLSAGAYEVGLIIDYNNLIEETVESDNSCLNPASIIYNAGCSPGNAYLSGESNMAGVLTAPDFFATPVPGLTHIIKAPTGDVSLQAGKYIDMLPGFTAEYGAHFKATIGDCSSNTDFRGQSEAIVIELTPEKQLDDEQTVEQSHAVRVIDTNPSESNKSVHSLHLTVNPNPFIHETIISYRLDSPSTVSLQLLDMAGKVMQVIQENVSKSQGEHSINFNRNEALSNGMYFLTLRSSDQLISKKVFIVN